MRETSLIRLVLIVYLQTGGSQHVYDAKALSELEYQMQAKLCSVRDEKNFSTLWKIMFESLFNAKPYLFNRNTYQVLLNAVKNEVKQ